MTERLPGRLDGGQVVRLLVDVDHVRPGLGDDPPESRKVEQVVIAVETDRRDQGPIPADVGRLVRLAGPGRRHHHGQIDVRARRDLLKLALIRANDERLGDHQHPQQVAPEPIRAYQPAP